jgi:hypothetical protein
MQMTRRPRSLLLLVVLGLFSPVAIADADPFALLVQRSLLFLVVAGIANLGAVVTLIAGTWGASFRVWLSRTAIFTLTYCVLGSLWLQLLPYERGMVGQWWGLQIAIGVAAPILAAVLAFRLKTKASSEESA